MSVDVRKQTTWLLLVPVSNQKKMWMSNDENLENVWEEIKNAVKVTPTMVFSVIGDSDSFVPCPWPRTVFQTALIEAAKSGGETWILYSGDGQEVSRSVQDAYRKYGNKEFGTKNGYIHKDNMNRHVKLINITDKETEDTRMETRVQCTSHIGRINNFLLEFEKFVSKQEVSIFSRKKDIKMPVPIAIIVCEGDIESIAHIAGALKNKLPVIIMKGSGKAADLILDYLEKSSELRKHAGMLFGIKFDDENIKALKKQLKIIHRNRDLIGVFDLNSDDPLKLSSIVGEVVVRCWSMEEINSTETQRIEKDTRLTTDYVNQWKITIGRPDSNTLNTTGSSITMRLLRQNSVQPEEKAMKEILEGYKKQPVPDVLNQKFTSPTSLPLYFYFGYQLLKESHLMQKCGHILLLEAIKTNRCDYAKVLLDQGVKLSKKHLPELYEQQILETEAQTLCHQYRCAMEKIGEDNAKLGKYLKKIEELESSVADSARRLCCRILQYEGNKEATTNRKSSDICETSDILLWAVFANRKEIAEICWIRGENHLLSGLVCSVLLQKLSRKAKNVEEHMLSRDLAEHAKLFEERCIKIMDEMYNDYTKQAVDSMDDEAMIWGVESSPLTIAYENFMYDVVGHTCSRKLMNKQWYNDLPPNVRPFCKMMFSTMLIMNSVFVLTSVETGYESTGELFEYYVYVWAAGDFLEEMICCFGLHGSRSRFHRGYYRRMKRYVYDFWNILDFLSYAILISAVCVRYLHPAPEPNEFIESNYITNARRLFSLSLLIMYVRFLEVFLIHPTLGPTLIMIKEMLKDLIHFLLIATFVIFGVGIYYHANLYPDHKDLWSADWSEWRFWRVLSLPYWQIYSDLQLEHVYGNTTCVKGDGSCPRFDWTVVVVAGGYILFTVLLLVNLVIAMFSNTFARVLQNSEKLWWYERYTAIHDYQWRVPSPFNVLFIPYRIYTVCKGSCFLKKDIEAANDFGGHKDENVMNAKEYRRELQNIIACNIYNKI